MSDPYRDGGQREGIEAPRDGGIVGDIIAQFADPNAFYRELIQNSIDAGSPDIVVDLAYDAGAQRMRVQVRDRGEGMTREIIENQLLVLFRSAKEKDKSKIGKFGVGFASVLSPNPEVVVVNTSRDGKRLTLHLYRDLTYELFDAGRATQTGTTVEIEIALERSAVAAFEEASEAALRRWCRHASVPITFAVRREDDTREVRIDMPLAIAAAHVEVRKTYDNGEMTIVAGLPVDGVAYLGFFNHGLMLYETTAMTIGQVAVKVQDSRLGHTISRDDVRRDSHYRRALELARKTVNEDLKAAASTKLGELAAAGGREYVKLLSILAATKLPIEPWHFPLTDPVGGKSTIAHTELQRRALVSSDSSPLTQALAEAGIPVVHVTDRNAYEQAFEQTGHAMVMVDSELTAVVHEELTDSDVALLAVLGGMLDKVHRKPDGVVLVRLTGARDDLIAVGLPDVHKRVLNRDEVGKNPFAMFGRRTLALSAGHPHIAAAREAADPVLAAAHVARAILLQYGLLDADRSESLLDIALSRLGVSA